MSGLFKITLNMSKQSSVMDINVIISCACAYWDVY